MSACSTVTWKEEVALHDGNKIIVTRTNTYDPKGLREIGQPPPLAESTLTFTVPGTKKEITWKSDFGRGYQDNLSLLLFDFSNGVPYIATHPKFCHGYNKWERPNPPYVFFKFEDEWKRIPLEQFPAELKEANVVISPGPNEYVIKKIQEMTSSIGFVPIEKIKGFNRDSEKDYRIIARKPIQTAYTACEKVIYNGNGGWLGIDWFTSQPSYDACLKACAQKKVSAQYCPCATLFKEKEK